MFNIRMALMTAFASLFVNATALAYAEKTYECANRGGLPNNTYKIDDVEVTPGISVPYVEIHRFHREVPSDMNSPVKEVVIRGFASVHSSAANKQSLSIGAMRLEFTDDELFGCN